MKELTSRVGKSGWIPSAISASSLPWRGRRAIAQARDNESDLNADTDSGST